MKKGKLLKNGVKDMITEDQEFIQIPNFSNYVISRFTLKIKNLSNGCEVQPLKNSKKVKFKLSKDGVSYYLTLFQIIRSIAIENMKPKFN